MSISNTLIAIDALIGLLEATSKIRAILTKAQTEGRDVSDAEVLAMTNANIQKSIELEELITQKLAELS